MGKGDLPRLAVPKRRPSNRTGIFLRLPVETQEWVEGLAEKEGDNLASTCRRLIVGFHQAWEAQHK